MPFTNSFKCFSSKYFSTLNLAGFGTHTGGQRGRVGLAVGGCVRICLLLSPFFYLPTLVAVSLGLCLVVCPLICLGALLLRPLLCLPCLACLQAFAGVLASLALRLWHFVRSLFLIHWLLLGSGWGFWLWSCLCCLNCLSLEYSLLLASNRLCVRHDNNAFLFGVYASVIKAPTLCHVCSSKRSYYPAS